MGDATSAKGEHSEKHVKRALLSFFAGCGHLGPAGRPMSARGFGVRVHRRYRIVKPRTSLGTAAPDRKRTMCDEGGCLSLFATRSPVRANSWCASAIKRCLTATLTRTRRAGRTKRLRRIHVPADRGWRDGARRGRIQSAPRSGHRLAAADG